jgi:hypothetical protein
MIATTNTDPAGAIENKVFRGDLCRRLNVKPVKSPPPLPPSAPLPSENATSANGTMTLKDVEKILICHNLHRVGGNKTKAAKILAASAHSGARCGNTA